MIICNSQMTMESSRSYETKTKATTITQLGNTSYETTSVMGESSNQMFFKDILEGEEEKTMSMKSGGTSIGLKSGYVSIENLSSQAERMTMKRVRELTLMQLLMKLRDSIYSKFHYKDGNINKNGAPNFADNLVEFQNEVTSDAGESVSIGKKINYKEYSESEITTFNTEGKVVTADGREISFGVAMSMTRKFVEASYGEADVVAVAQNFCDPLVINLDDNISEVSDQEFLFDIDSDGVLDSISALNARSGFIALDLNDDGIINDGSELFGTKSGSGFADLAMYDEDGNGWIDEADSVFDKLLIWTKDEKGEDVLYHLKDKGVGALCLESVPTSFSLKDIRDNTTNAVIRETGVFLYENGNVGTLQHLDLAT